MPDAGFEFIEQIRAISDWHADEWRKADDWAFPDGRRLGVTNRAMNRIDAALAAEDGGEN